MAYISRIAIDFIEESIGGLAFDQFCIWLDSAFGVVGIRGEGRRRGHILRAKSFVWPKKLKGFRKHL